MQLNIVGNDYIIIFFKSGQNSTIDRKLLLLTIKRYLNIDTLDYRI